MRSKTLHAATLAALVLAAVTACASDDKSSSAPSSSATAAATSSATAGGDAEAAGVHPHEYCHAVIELAQSASRMAGRSGPSAGEAASTADGYTKLAAIAPAEAKADITRVSADYRAVAKGQKTIEAISADVAQASQRLTNVNLKYCAGSMTGN